MVSPFNKIFTFIYYIIYHIKAGFRIAMFENVKPKKLNNNGRGEIPLEHFVISMLNRVKCLYNKDADCS